MAHRDIPVVSHHINFTPVPPVFAEKGDKMKTGGESSEKKGGMREIAEGGGGGGENKEHSDGEMLILKPAPTASDCCHSCLMNKQMRISPKLIFSLTILLALFTNR